MTPVTPAGVWLITPFVLLLLSIALMPFIARNWWDRFYPVVSLALAAVTVSAYTLFLGEPGRMLHSASEYLSFIILIGSLFVVAGGIHIDMGREATPGRNVLLLAAGALASNLIGTTGASMIMIRPYIRVNRSRWRGFHVVFFIFIVSNIGGAMTPVGDPPLFLGYLRGVPFFWMAENVWAEWILALGLVLGIFYLLDSRSFRRHAQTAADVPSREAAVGGIHNVIFLGIILGAAFLRPVVREAAMIAAAAGSYVTSRGIHPQNDFSFHPVREVAILFLGIFATMVPALDWLEMNAAKAGFASPGNFYWGTGITSSVLDNAPTYLSFLTAAIGLTVDRGILQQIQQLLASHNPIPLAGPEEIRKTFSVLAAHHPDFLGGRAVGPEELKIAYMIANHAIYLKAVSLAAVFFGACTYIGNGPNFLVKSIAERSGLEVPGFLPYIARYTLPLLLPVFALVWWLFFSG